MIGDQLRGLGFWGAIVAVIALYASRRYLFSRRWPITAGHVESCCVNTDRMVAKASVPLEVATAEIAYSYKIGDQFYSGYHEESFTDEQRAWDYVHSVQGREVAIRYNRRQPDRSYMEGVLVPTVSPPALSSP
jgi:hypothetical protein